MSYWKIWARATREPRSIRGHRHTGQCSWGIWISRLYCKSLPSIFQPSERQIALYSPCQSVGRQSVTFWSWYWSRDHFGLKKGLGTSLHIVSHFGLKMVSTLVLRPFWSQKRSRDPVSSLSVSRSVGWLVSPLIFLPFLLCNRLEQKKNKDQNSNIWGLHCLLDLVFAGFLLLTSWIKRNINSLFLSICLISGKRLSHGATYSLYQRAR